MVVKLGIGVDIEETNCFAAPDCVRGSAFLNKIFTSSEQEYCFSLRQPFEHLAARYAAKEAVVKALAGVGKQSVPYRYIEVINDVVGIPEVRLHAKTTNNLQIRLTLSHSNDKAIAFAVVILTRPWSNTRTVKYGEQWMSGALQSQTLGTRPFVDRLRF